MSQEDDSRFSHITVGKLPLKGSAPIEDEEVIAIGAVDGDDAVLQDDNPEGEATGAARDRVSVRMTGDFVSKSPQSNADEDFGGPLSLPYRIVIGACVVGVIVVIVFLVRYYLFSG